VSRYLLYARKSSESEDRQVLSIDSQIHELKDLARSRGLAVVSILSEARSAKAPGRPVFGKMMAEISHGRVDGILCWKLDRLARNPVDGGALIWALDEGKLTEIATREKAFTNRGDEKFWMQLEFGMAKKYVDDLSDNVKRGNRAKLEQGWLPGVPPIGYLNELATKTIIPDPERFERCCEIFRLILGGRSVNEIVEIADRQWHFRSVRRHRTGDRPLTRTNVYRMLSNPFYYGLIVQRGGSYTGAHPPMITKDEFDQIQEFLGRPNRRARDRHDFAYTSLIRCGECGASVTAENKVQRHGHQYVYYHCTKRRAGPRCSQPSIEVTTLEEQIADALARIKIDDEILDWAIRYIRELQGKGAEKATAARDSLADSLRSIRKEADTLLNVRLQGLVSDDEYAAKKQTLVEKEIRVKERIAHEETAPTRWFEPAAKTFIFANRAPKLFPMGSSAEKREIVLSFGSNLVLKDKTLRMSAQKPFLIIEDGRRSFDWQRLCDRIRTYFLHNSDSIRWPSFCEEWVAQFRKRGKCRTLPAIGVT
jgi:DNA invertase Pin-like site-specific DNA recombinase